MSRLGLSEAILFWSGVSYLVIYHLYLYRLVRRKRIPNQHDESQGGCI